MAARRAGEGERAQSTVEWVGLLLVVSLLLASMLALAPGRSPTGLARSIATRLICATDLSGSCAPGNALVAAYGPELAARVYENAPEIDYEAGMSELPVDFRSCRAPRCSEGRESGPVWVSEAGAPATAFVHVVDCGASDDPEPSVHSGFDCSGERSGNAYIQYWLYYGDSATSPWSDLPGRPGYHRDDWEGYQLRIGGAGTEARATSHRGYAYRGGPVNWPSDSGVIQRSAWGRATGRLYVSGGSHAGHVYEPPRLALLRGVRTAGHAGAALVSAAAGRHRAQGAGSSRVRFVARRRPSRWTPAGRLRLIPIESLDAAARRTGFSIAPPWRKPVYRDPEDEGT